MEYQAILPTSFALLGIRCSEDALTGIDFLPAAARPYLASGSLVKEVSRQIGAYVADPGFRFSLPLDLSGTAHQREVWQIMCAIPSGQVLRYGDIAETLKSSPRAVGQACGNNPVPIVIPCHRVVSKAGLGGFMHHAGGFALEIKRRLLEHERR